VTCVLEGSICCVGDVCRFGWCRCCGGRLDFVNVFCGWVACRMCGFTNRRKKVRRLSSFG
jgi:hypothetical protein